MPTHPRIQISDDKSSFRWNSSSPLRNAGKLSIASLFQSDIPTRNTSVNYYSDERSSINIGENQSNKAMLLKNPSYDILQGFWLLGISNHDASTRNGTIYNDSTYLNWNNDRQSVLAGTSISDTSQSSRPHCNQRQNLFSHTTENLNYGNKTGNSTSFMSPPSRNRAGSHNNNNFSAVGNRVLPNQMYNTNAYNVTHANNMKPAIQNCTEEISISESMFSSDF